MALNARYAHTNLIARDWQALASFYERVFGCTRLAPERHFSGAVLEAGTGVAGARLDGVHLRLPGCGVDGPTLEVFSYNPGVTRPLSRVDEPGYGHIAFQVSSVSDARAEMLREGGSSVGDVVSLRTDDGRTVTWCYVRDPEGNIVEVQSWQE